MATGQEVRDDRVVGIEDYGGRTERLPITFVATSRGRSGIAEAEQLWHAYDVNIFLDSGAMGTVYPRFHGYPAERGSNSHSRTE